jgi:autotransporter translocation and assembly factor TamB
MRAALRRVLFAVFALLAAAGAILGGAFFVAQTPSGKAWIAREAGRLSSSPGFVVAIEGLAGTVPFRMTAKRITIADAKGRWLSI